MISLKGRRYLAAFVNSRIEWGELFDGEEEILLEIRRELALGRLKELEIGDYK